MFVAQLRPQDAQFEICALNAANERESGMSMAHVAGRPLNEILPPQQAADVYARYISCLQQETPIRYCEKLQMPKGAMIWDTLLCRLDMPDGRARIVGTALVVERVQQAPDMLGFHDAASYATAATQRLNQLADVLTELGCDAVSTDTLTGSAAMLAALCETVNETLADLGALPHGALQPDMVPGAIGRADVGIATDATADMQQEPV